MTGLVLLGILATSIFANIPQITLTQFYFIFSHAFTRKAVAAEWAQYVQRAKPLRVTDRKGSQVSTHWLGLPYRYGIPIQVVGALLHWLASQAFFIVSFKSIDLGFGNDHRDLAVAWADPDAETLVRTGFSTGALIWMLVLTCCVLLLSLLDDNGFLPRGMPVVGTRSLLIAAACKTSSTSSRQENRSHMTMYPVRWGVLEVDDGVAHCGFTDDTDGVRSLDEGEPFACDDVVFSADQKTTRSDQSFVSSSIAAAPTGTTDLELLQSSRQPGVS